MDSVVSMLSRPGWLAALGALALVSFLAVNLLVWSFLRQSPTPTPSLPRRPHLEGIEDVRLKGGQKREVLLAVQRRDCTEPLRIQVDGLPDDMKAPPLTLAADRDTVPLLLLAPLDLELPSRSVIVSLWQGTQRVDEQPFRLSVRKVPRPVLLEREELHCKAGETKVFTPKVDRKECPEPLTVRFDHLPPGVRQEELPGPALKLTVAADATPEELHPITLTLRVGDAIADTAPLFFHIEKAAPRVALKRENVPDSVSVPAGQREELRVLVQREGYDGPVEIRLDGLPAGVTADPAAIAAQISFGTVRIEAGARAELGRSSVKVLALVEGEKIDEREIALTVEKPLAKPSEDVTAIPQEPTTIRFDSIDGVTLKGTLYPGRKGKKGACVLLVHDIGVGRHRLEENWRRLAVALQTAGHTVLTFDLRGHGQSNSVNNFFWQQKANQDNLPEYRTSRKSKGKIALPDSIDVRYFPPLYSYFLILDLAAARSYLDSQNDDPKSSVNSGNLILVGAGQSATLSTLWLASECRRILDPAPGAKRLPGELSEGQRVLAAVWLSVDGWLGSCADRVQLSNWFRDLTLNYRIPMLLLCGGPQQDPANAMADHLLRDLRVPPPPRTRKQTIDRAIGSGQQLLQVELDTEKTIVAYVEDVLKTEAHPSAERDVIHRTSWWQLPNGQRVAAKLAGETLLFPVPLERLGIPLTVGRSRRP